MNWFGNNERNTLTDSNTKVTEPLPPSRSPRSANPPGPISLQKYNALRSVYGFAWGSSVCEGERNQSHTDLDMSRRVYASLLPLQTSRSCVDLYVGVGLRQ